MTVKEILSDPTASYWLKDAIETAYKRDPIDAMNDARRLLKMLVERYTQIVNRDPAIVSPKLGRSCESRIGTLPLGAQ